MGVKAVVASEPGGPEVLALAEVALQAKYTFETTRESLRALTGPGRVIPRRATFAVRVGLEPPVDSSLLEAISREDAA